MKSRLENGRWSVDCLATFRATVQVRQTIVSSTRAQASLPYPRGFHNDSVDSGCSMPVSSQARAIILNGPGFTSTVSDQGRHDHRLGAG
jgi:hypothetical protein